MFGIGSGGQEVAKDNKGAGGLVGVVSDALSEGKVGPFALWSTGSTFKFFGDDKESGIRTKNPQSHNLKQKKHKHKRNRSKSQNWKQIQNWQQRFL